MMSLYFSQDPSVLQNINTNFTLHSFVFWIRLLFICTNLSQIPHVYSPKLLHLTSSLYAGYEDTVWMQKNESCHIVAVIMICPVNYGCFNSTLLCIMHYPGIFKIFACMLAHFTIPVIHFRLGFFPCLIARLTQKQVVICFVYWLSVSAYGERPQYMASSSLFSSLGGPLKMTYAGIS